MPFGVANAPALFQELMNKILYILRRGPLVQELISRGAEMEAQIDDVSLGTNTQEDNVLLLREFFIVRQENHLRIKLEKCEFMKEEMEYFGLDVGYGWWKPAASKMQPLQDMQIRDDPKKGLHDVRSFVGACNFYRRHIHNFTYSSAPITDLIKKTTPWRWTARVKRYPEPMAHGPEACEPSHPCGSCGHRLSPGYPCSLIRGIWNPILNH